MQGKIYSIPYDIKQGVKTYEVFNFTSEDNGSCQFDFTISNKDVVYNLAGTIVRLVAKSPTGLTIQQDCTVATPTSGKASILLLQSFFSVAGKWTAELQIYNSVDQTLRLSLPQFTYRVGKSLMDDGTVEASDEFSLLQNMIINVSDASALATQALDTANTALVTADDAVTTITAQIANVNVAVAEVDDIVAEWGPLASTIDGKSTNEFVTEMPLVVNRNKNTFYWLYAIENGVKVFKYVEDYSGNRFDITQEMEAKIATMTDLVNGVINTDITEVLNNALVATNIEDKLNAKETEYAPRLTSAETQILQKANQNDIKLIGSVKYGEIILPSDFNHNLDFNLWRGTDGEVKHNFDFDKKTEGWTTYYISETGNQASDGLTQATAKKSLTATILEIEANGEVTSAKLVIIGDYLTRNSSVVSRGVSKNYAIVGLNENVYMGTIEAGLSWTLHTLGVYKASRTGCEGVFDDKFKKVYNLPQKLVKKITLAECESTKGSWYTDGTLVYVHRQDDSIPLNTQLFVTVSSPNFQITFNADKLFLIKNVTFLYGGNASACYFKGATLTGNVILDNVKVHSTRGNANAISSEDIKSIWSFDSMAIEIGRDGFNYHNYLQGSAFAFEYNCFAENCGINDTNSNNNATSAHDGMSVLRVASKGNKSKGPVLADVNGCYTICIDCNMQNSMIIGESTAKASFYFDDSITTKIPSPNGKAILINCSGGDKAIFGINCDTSFKSQDKITIDNFVGKNIPSDINFKIV